MHYPFNNRTWVTSYRISQYTVYHTKCAKPLEVITQLISSKKCYINTWPYVNLNITTNTLLFHDTVCYCMVSVPINHHHALTFGKHKSLTVFFSDAQNFAYRIVEVNLNNDPCNITENLKSSNPGVHKPQMSDPWITTSCTLAPNTCGTCCIPCIWHLKCT